MTPSNASEAAEPPPEMSARVLLRGLRIADGTTLDIFGAALGCGESTVRRWESGKGVPAADAERNLVDYCQTRGLFRSYLKGALKGHTITAEFVRSVLTQERLRKTTARWSATQQAAPTVTGTEAVQAGPPLPTGTLTFLLTDLEGSSHQMEAQPKEMRQALEQHDRLIEKVVAEYGGFMVRAQGEGDSRFAVFTQASSGVAAAAAMQLAFHSEHWPTSHPLRIRIGLHTGEAELRERDYYGPPVNRCARLRGVAHGGQTLLSNTTADLAADELSEHLELVDLGTHRLRDLLRPEHIFQLRIAGLSDSFPPLTGLDAHVHNLPVQLTPLIGRDAELDRLRGDLLNPGVRLLTLIGPGGVGKTRLALQAAADLVDSFPDGVFFVQLAAVDSPDLVLPAIARVLAVREAAGQSNAERLIEHLGDRRALLVLDNFEQIVHAASLVVGLISACANLKILVTSRAILHVDGEYDFPVKALGFPLELETISAHQVIQYDALRLFVERVRATLPSFAVTPHNARVIAAICRRVDGLPLAIELAAARARHLSLDQLLSRLNLGILNGGNQNLPIHQRTLRGTIAWSYDLLSDAERGFFRQFGVFVGSASLEACEAVCDDHKGNVIDLLGQLIDSSLLLVTEQPAEDDSVQVRYSMLETVREFALDQLRRTGELTSIQQRHAKYYTAWAERGIAHLRTSEESAWLRQLEQEQDNIRADLGWCAESSQATLGLRLAAAVWPMWNIHGWLTEGRQHLQYFITAAHTSEPLVRARALEGAGVLAYGQDDYDQAATFDRQCLELRTAAGDRPGAAIAHFNLGYVAFARGDYPAARTSIGASFKLRRTLGDVRGIADCLSSLGGVAWVTGDNRHAARLLERSLKLRRAIADKMGIALSLRTLAEVRASEGQLDEAAAHLDESLRLRRAIGDKTGVGHTLLSAGDLARRRGRADEALQHYRESLIVDREIGNRFAIARCLDRVAGILARDGDPLAAARLFGSASAIRRATGSVLAPQWQATNERDIATAQERTSPSAFARAWSLGEALPLAEAVHGALEAIEGAFQAVRDQCSSAPALSRER